MGVAWLWFNQHGAALVAGFYAEESRAQGVFRTVDVFIGRGNQVMTQVEILLCQLPLGHLPPFCIETVASRSAFA